MSVSELLDRGFVVLPGPYAGGELTRVSGAYDAAVAAASSNDVGVGSTTTRVTDFVNRGPSFDALYIFPPLLEAAGLIIETGFKLSSLHARTLRAGSNGQGLHVDVRRDTPDWPLVGFILMVDEFRADNGATAFVPGSQHWAGTPDDGDAVSRIHETGQLLGCGPAGSLLIFNGSTWHGHTANLSNGPRRSLQGAFIPRGGRAGTDWASRMTAETRARLSARALDVLAL